MLNPSRYRIIAIGKVRKTWVQNGLSIYLKRLPGLEITELRDSTPQREAEAIRASLRSNESLAVLTEEGQNIDSIQFTKRLQEFGSTRLAFAIGGANGLTHELKAIANWEISLSAMTFPHEIARLLLIEQIYRAQAILQNSPYHRR